MVIMQNWIGVFLKQLLENHWCKLSQLSFSFSGTNWKLTAFAPQKFCDPVATKRILRQISHTFKNPNTQIYIQNSIQRIFYIKTLFRGWQIRRNTPQGGAPLRGAYNTTPYFFSALLLQFCLYECFVLYIVDPLSVCVRLFPVL